jgi:hypothetical protein
MASNRGSRRLGTKLRSRLWLSGSIVAAAGAVLIYATLEIALAVPLPLSLYLPGIMALLVISTVAALADRQTWRRAALVGAAGSLLLVLLFLVPWTSRKSFLRHLHRVETGMTRREAREVMLPYRPVGEGEVTADTADSYRHETQNPRYNSDVGLIEFEDGRVAEVKFLPD